MKPRRSEYDISGDVLDIISRLGADVQDLDNKTILITGGTGFFGRWLLQILCSLIVDKNFKINVYVVTRNPKKFLEQNLEHPFDENINFICGDVVNFKLPNIKIDYLIHMATTAATETFGGEDQLKKLDLLYREQEIHLSLQWMLALERFYSPHLAWPMGHPQAYLFPKICFRRLRLT